MQKLALTAAAGFVAMGLGCGGMERMLNGAITPEKKEPTQEEYNWKSVEEDKAASAKAPAVTDKASWEEAHKLWLNYVSQLDIYIDQNCDTGTPAKRCGQANSEMQRASAAYLDVLGQGMKVSGLAFDDLQDKVLDAERQELQGNYSIDAWMRDIGGRKVAYWGGELGQKGGLAKYVERKNEATCGAYAAKPGKDDAKGLDFVFEGSESAFVKCQFTKSPSTFQRDDGDYWLIRIMWAGSWEYINLSYDVAKPSTTNSADFSFPVDIIKDRIEKKAAETNFVYPGNWLRVQAAYMTRYKTGREWRDAKWVDTWQHDEMAATTFYVKWK